MNFICSVQALLKGLIDTNQNDVTSDNSIPQEETMKYHNVTLKKTKGGTWFTRVRTNGEQIYISDTTQNKLILKLKTFFKSQKQLSLDYSPKSLTLERYYNSWLKVYKHETKKTTKRAYQTAFNRFSPDLKKTLLQNITTEQAVNEIRKFDGTRSAQQMYVLLKDILDKALQENKINNNPLKNVPIPKYTSPEKRILNLHQQKLFIEACKKHRLGDFYLTILFQGLRRGEALMLKPNDIDIKNMTLRIDESITDGSDETTTKNSTSNRIMPLFNISLPIIEKYTSLPKDERIFHFNTKTLSEGLTKICEMANIPKFTTHELRHTFISFCKNIAKIPEPVVQKWVGHKIGSKVTGEIYTHVDEETSKKYSDLLNNI